VRGIECNLYYCNINKIKNIYNKCNISTMISIIYFMKGEIERRDREIERGGKEDRREK